MYLIELLFWSIAAHTSYKKTLKELIKKTKKGGSIVVDFILTKDFGLYYTIYFKTNYKRMPKETLLHLIKFTAPLFYKTHLFLKIYRVDI